MDLEQQLEHLKRAFPPRPIEGVHAFVEWGKTHLDAESFSAAVDGTLWTELEPAFLEYHHDALGFFGPSSIGDFLAPPQQRAIADALAAYEVKVEGTPRQQPVRAALDRYWRSLR